MKTRRNNAAEIALNKKLRLERVLYKEVAAIFRDITAKAGQPFHSVRSHEHDIELALLKHYRRVFAEFGDDYRQEHDLQLTEIQAAMLAADADSVFEKKAQRQARIITNTNEKQLAKTKRIAESQIAELQAKDPRLSFAKHAADLYSAVLMRRVESISIYETQWSAEFSKAHEVAYLMNGRGVQTKAKPNVANFKRWDSVGDDRVRQWHADVDGTVVPVDEPFDVNDEQLMYPGDESLGATASNIVNCRCSVWYDIDEDALMGLDSLINKGDGGKIPARRKDQNLATAADFNRVWGQLADVTEDVNKIADQITNLKEVHDYLEDISKRLVGLQTSFENGNPVKKQAISALTREINNTVHLVRMNPQPGTWVIREGPVTKHPQNLSYEPDPVRVSDVPEGFKTNIDDAMKKAEEEIAQTLKDHDVLGPYEVRNRIASLNWNEGNKQTGPILAQNGKMLTEQLRDNVMWGGPHLGTNQGNAMLSSRAEQMAHKAYHDVVDIMSPNLYSPKMDSLVTKITGYEGVASADPVSNMIKAFAPPGRMNMEFTYQIAHEFGHHIEFDNPAVKRRFQDWRKKRLDAAIARGEGWEWDEMNRTFLIKDGFYHPYISKLYPDGNTEALSMGVEALFDPFKFDTILNKDPEHLRLVWATLRGY